ncbi:hypothetical protein MMC10_000983 [Thelotrema lepadinum]|nr:hypothetical protein [Thelotrema lepadinum]
MAVRAIFQTRKHLCAEATEAKNSFEHQLRNNPFFEVSSIALFEFRRPTQTIPHNSSQSSRRKPNPLKRLPGAPRKLSPTQALKRPTKRGRPRGKGKERDKSRPPNKRQPKAKRDAKNQVFERLNLPGHGYVPGARNIYELGSVFEQIDKSAEKQSSGKDKISEQGQAILDQDRKGRNDHERPLHLFSTRPTEPRSSRSRKSNKSTKGDSEYAKAIQGSRLIQSPQRNKYLKHGQDPRRGQGSKLDLIVDDTQRPKQRKLAKHSQKSKQKQQDYGGIPNYLRFQSDLHIQSPVQFQQNVEVQGHLHVNAPARFEQKAQVQGPMYINAPTEFLRGTQVKGPVQFNAPTLFRSPPKQAPPE